MNIVTELLDTAVQKDEYKVLVITNPSDKDYSYNHQNEDGSLTPYVVKAQSVISIAKVVARGMAIQMAKDISYERCTDRSQWKGVFRPRWQPIFEEIISYPQEAEVIKAEVLSEYKPAQTEVVFPPEPEPVQEEVKEKIDYESLEWNTLRNTAKLKGITTAGKNRLEILAELKNK
jgi:hypothetical protein